MRGGIAITQSEMASLRALYSVGCDPNPLLQAGADRNLMRQAEEDGLRLLVWLAKYVEKGTDPLKTLIQLAGDAGFDVDPEDMAWANEIVPQP